MVVVRRPSYFSQIKNNTPTPHESPLVPKERAPTCIKTFLLGGEKMVVVSKPSYLFTNEKEHPINPRWYQRRGLPHASKGCVNGQFLNRFRDTMFHFHH